MSFDDYVNHISQKIKLATAIAVIRSKPENLNTTEYIEKLRKTYESMDGDSDVTMCSDDFDVEYDDVTIHKDPDMLNRDNVTENFEPYAPNIIDNIQHNMKDINDSKGAQNDTLNDQIIDNPMDKGTCNDNVSGHNIDSQNLSNNVDKTTKDTFIEILQDLKVVQNPLDKSNQLHECRSLENSQDLIEDPDSDATYCETITNTQIMLNNTLEETEIYSISDFTPFYTHYSESQMKNVAINPKMIYKNEAKLPQNPINTEKKAQICESLNGIFLNEYNTNENTINLEANMTFSQNAQHSESLNDINMNMKEQNIFSQSNNVRKIDSNYANVLNYDSSFDKDLNSNVYDANIRGDINSTKIIDKYKRNKIDENENNHTNFDNEANTVNDNLNTNGVNANEAISQNLANDIDKQSNESDDMTDSQREVVPFKVIEELNKIKNYIKKRNDRRVSVDGSSDSGYRSDSQGRSFKNAVHLSSTLINQSAHSLLTYIISCSLTKNTYEITKEVSKTLGSLIDKLHEDEIYPLFLEVLLETITELLRSIYEDECSNMLLTKDEKVQRVLLLNKSTHIQKYTIDKITNILQTIDTEANEINHTARMENLCYIFHILEIILSKYEKDDNSQSQDSQEKVLKRSSITDIWRKKWNLSKEVVVENVEKKCPLTKCSEVLNKMIVNCMEGYSLISFVALKCFNLLQP